MVATPYEILRFAQRGTGRSDYLALRAALDRLQSTTVATTLRQRERPNGAMRVHRFSWINEWKEYVQPGGRSDGIELILADWFFAGVMDEGLVLTHRSDVFPAYRGASSAGCTVWCASTAGDQPGGLAASTCKPPAPANPAALQRPYDFAMQTYAHLAWRGRRCRAIAWASSAVPGIEWPSRSDRSGHGVDCPRHGDKRCMACGRARAIGRVPASCYHGVASIVPSGVPIGRNQLNDGAGFAPVLTSLT